MNNERKSKDKLIKDLEAAQREVDDDGTLHLPLSITANGAVFVVIEPH